MIRKIYDWVLRNAEKPYAAWILFATAVAEASFFPLPPDILLLPMIVAQRERAWRLAAICTAGSVLGGILGYAIGAFAMATVGQWIVDTYHLERAFQTFHDGFNEWGVWIILIKGLTPIPFKLVTIASGVAQLNMAVFVLAALATRGARFFLLAALVYKFGEPIRLFIEKYLTWIAFGVLLAIIAGFWIVLG
ncbi:MAG: DedA family protein [Alphaproteobacteria bacterium]|nr:DedA family protein [Alphaproteobacteria bacterium]